MTDHPILFSVPMVRAILSGSKTQTRRVLKPQPQEDLGLWLAERDMKATRWAPGDTLWVRETWTPNALTYGQTALYKADGIHTVLDDGDGYTVLNKDGTEKSPWRPSIHMPRWASRITLTVEAVRVERLQDITEGDAEKEGAEPTLVSPDGGSAPHVEGFCALWNTIHGPDAWDANPWVSVTTFRRVEA